MSEDRFDRNERLFGKEGQARLRQTRIVVMGAGGLGSWVIQQSALLGVGVIATVDREDLSNSNRNRYSGAWHSDPVPGSPKVELAKRHVHLIDPRIEFTAIHDDILSLATLDALKAADYVVGCVDDDGVRLFLNEACLAYEKTLIDLASDVPEPGKFGGRVAVITGSRGCLHCLDLLDAYAVRRSLSSRELLENEAAVYGISLDALSETGPSVVSMNGVVASLGVTAFMKLVTGMELPYTIQTYRGDLGTVTRTSAQPSEDCYYCSAVRGLRDKAGLERYFKVRSLAAA
ncbi:MULTISPECIES: ThiF family adenylyltransferase [Rhodomicrobium]|uniref:HesA/MoeB/ThiF family protein n=1 Tax=Rhodomicrobium TaxID=1068 RepID=UPI000B4BEF88|nr:MULTISPECIES: ThiF family adenylyltransferase [Rhodomicrobium]